MFYYNSLIKKLPCLTLVAMRHPTSVRHDSYPGTIRTHNLNLQHEPLTGNWKWCMDVKHLWHNSCDIFLPTYLLPKWCHQLRINLSNLKSTCFLSVTWTHSWKKKNSISKCLNTSKPGLQEKNNPEWNFVWLKNWFNFYLHDNIVSLCAYVNVLAFCQEGSTLVYSCSRNYRSFSKNWPFSRQWTCHTFLSMFLAP